MQRVKLHKSLPVWLRSWAAFIVAVAMLLLVWAGGWLLVARFAPAGLTYFTVGSFGALILGAVMLILNEPIVVWSMGAKWIRRREDNPKLWDAVKRATPWHLWPGPRIYVLPSRGMNAISFGWGIRGLSAVGATQGIIRELNDDELASVMAHEVGHILNKDILVSMIMTIMVMMMAFTGWLLLRLGPYSSSSRSSSKRSNGATALLVIILVGFAFYGFGRLLGMILQMFVSRQREYAADAKGSRIMGSSRPLASALRKISGNPSMGNRTANAAFGFLCTADPDESDLMATHPNMRKRLAALEWLEE